MTTQLINSQVSKFNSLALAKSFAANCKKAQLIVKGDDAKFWVASMGFAAKLERAGYEVIN